MSRLVYRTGGVFVVVCMCVWVYVCGCLATKNHWSCCLGSMLNSVSMKMHAGLRLWLYVSLYNPLSILYDLYNKMLHTYLYIYS